MEVELTKMKGMAMVLVPPMEMGIDTTLDMVVVSGMVVVTVTETGKILIFRSV
jgi:hypothetical protein